MLPEQNAQARDKMTDMTRRARDVLYRLFGADASQPHTIDSLRQLTRRPMDIKKLSIDPRGEWSQRQAQRVLAIINPEAERQQMFFLPLDVTTYRSTSPRRVMLVAYCMRHEIAVMQDELCSECARNAPPMPQQYLRT